jgi:hypothetical protein
MASPRCDVNDGADERLEIRSRHSHDGMRHKDVLKALYWSRGGAWWPTAWATT